MFFVADGSALINAIYDYEGFNAGKYGETGKFIPANDNRKWALDVIAESLMSTLEGEEGQPAENALVIFDESRHPQNALLADSYNTVYFLLVYFTGERLAILALFVVLSLHSSGSAQEEIEPWRHVFSIIYMGSEMQIGTCAKTEKMAGVLIEKFVIKMA